MVYGAETWAVQKIQAKKLDVAEMRMLSWISRVTKLDRIRKERIRGTTKVGEISKKLRQSRLKWYGHVLHVFVVSVGLPNNMFSIICLLICLVLL